MVNNLFGKKACYGNLSSVSMASPVFFIQRGRMDLGMFLCFDEETEMGQPGISSRPLASYLWNRSDYGVVFDASGA